MKSTIVTTILLASFFTAAAAQRREPARQGVGKPAIKEVRVTRQAVAKQRTVLDLTRQGTMYTLPSGVDYSRVVVRTSKGETTLAELVTKSGRKISGNLRLATTADMRVQRAAATRRPGRASGLNYSCDGLACSCTGDDDCNDLFSSDKCGPIAICYPDGCVCIRI